MGTLMLTSKFKEIELSFTGDETNKKYFVKLFNDGRFYFKINIENNLFDKDRTTEKSSSYQINQKEIYIFEEIIEYMDLISLNFKGTYKDINKDYDKTFFLKIDGKTKNNVKNVNLLIEFMQSIIRKYDNSVSKIFLLETNLIGSGYIRDFNKKIEGTKLLDLFREYNNLSINKIAVFNENGEKVGYISEDKSEILSRLIDGGKKLIALPLIYENNIQLQIYLIN